MYVTLAPMTAILRTVARLIGSVLFSFLSSTIDSRAASSARSTWLMPIAGLISSFLVISAVFVS